MKLTTKFSAIAVAATFALGAPASAGLIDFTNDTVGLSGALGGGITWEVTGDPKAPNTDEAFNGASLAEISPLKGDNDGLGIQGDELTSSANEPQSVTITFSEEVKLYTAYFMDVYFQVRGLNGALPTLDQMESGVMAVDGVVAAEVFASNPNPGQSGTPSAGFETINGVFKGTSFTFFAGAGFDDSTSDVSLAGVSVAAIPLPAGMLLLGTALGGLGLARRRKKA